MFRINLFVLTFHELHEFVIVNAGGNDKSNNGTCEFVGLALGISDQPGLVPKYCGNPPAIFNTEGIRYGLCGLSNLHIEKHHVVELHFPLPSFRELFTFFLIYVVKVKGQQMQPVRHYRTQCVSLGHND